MALRCTSDAAIDETRLESAAWIKGNSYDQERFQWLTQSVFTGLETSGWDKSPVLAADPSTRLCVWECGYENGNSPSGSRSCGMPSSVSANRKASCRFSLFGLPHTRSMSTTLGRRAWMTAKNANPVRQLGPKSFTAIPRRLEGAEN